MGLTLSSPPPLPDERLESRMLLLLTLLALLPGSRPSWPCEGFGFEPRRLASRKMLEKTGDSDPIELALFTHLGECGMKSVPGEGTVKGERDTPLAPAERLEFPASERGCGEGVGVGEGVGLARKTEVVMRTWPSVLASGSSAVLAFSSRAALTIAWFVVDRCSAWRD